MHTFPKTNTAGTKEVETPLMKQYCAIKTKYPDALLLFRVGDFYETFGEDAVRASKILGIVLTKRANGAASFVDLAGFPYHSLDSYLPKLVRAGLRVAICDQLEDPKLAKTIVKRGVTEVVTPGVVMNEQVLDRKCNNFLAAVHIAKDQAGVSFLDVSTGEFLITQGNMDYLEKLLQNFAPNEVLYQKNCNKEFCEGLKERFHTFGMDDWVFMPDFTLELLLKHFGTSSLKGFGVEDLDLGIIAAGAALHYLADTQHDKIKHIGNISRVEEDQYVWLDKFTIRNLELFGSPNENAVTLIEIIDRTISPMGSRLLKRWIALPLKNRLLIEERHDMVEFLMKHTDTAAELRKHIHHIGDMERLISKAAALRISPREVIQLKRGLSVIEPVKVICKNMKNDVFNKIGEQLNPCTLIKDRIEREIHPDPPALVSKGNVIRNEVNGELDELRKIAFSGKDYLLSIQQRESKRTGITSLKVAFNNVFGYYIEVTNVHKNKVPVDWIRKQTLVNAERYITEELKEYETKILGAEEKIASLENRLYNDLVLSLADHIAPIQLNASLIARIDCLLSFAMIARENSYVRPEMDESKVLDIRKGRHPVIEKHLPIGEEYIANDVYLDNESQQIIIITGPNMSGKSALLRQTALIVMMAQTGCFVPAEKAKIGIIDKIFTRVGASDNISLGESTFMVEMNETASILNNLSDRSLILLDEIGRGTSTYDGISIAWAISEYLHEHISRPKTLFATHYHELNEMSESFSRIKNFNVSVKEMDNRVIFLRKLVPGGTEHSFGIHVARMAGMPKIVVEHAISILEHLEKSHNNAALTGSPGKKNEGRGTAGDGGQRISAPSKSISPSMQLSFFPPCGSPKERQSDNPVLSHIKDEILQTDINTLTPVEALMKLNEIKKMIERK